MAVKINIEMGNLMKINFLLPVGFSFLISACASPYPSAKAAKIQVHRQVSTLVSKCENLGPIEGQGGGTLMGYIEATEMAENQARELVVDKGGDTLVILNADGDGSKLTLQGTAMKCY